MAPTQPYGGRTRKLILGFDVGTTYSGIGYAILDPGEIPKIQCVTRFPGQENGDFKIPSILWYTPQGTMLAAGAEARDPAVEMMAEEKNLIFVEWFKLHLRPPTLVDDTKSEIQLHPLPPGKTVVDVFADFLKYLFQCTKDYIINSHPNGESLWNSVKKNIDVVLSHPNGWEGLQQDKMRQAAIKAGLVENSSSEGQRLSFVTEGEASIQYCVGLGMAAGAIETGNTVMLVDAGGGTIDLSTYFVTSMSPIVLEEIAPIGCILQGSTRVNVRAERFLRTKLAGSKYGYFDEIRNMIQSFETYTKPTFKDPGDKAFIKFGSMRDRDPDYGIRNGQLILDGEDVSKLFEPSIQGILDAVSEQEEEATKPVTLVGGFAASPWLFQRVKEALKARGIHISRPDHHTNKAVAEGAVSFALEHYVSFRIATVTYGIHISLPYDASDHEHRCRQSESFVDASGETWIRNSFRILVSKGKKFDEETPIRHPLWLHRKSPDELKTAWVELMAYRGSEPTPEWIDVGNFTTLCKVTGDTSKVRRVAESGAEGTYYTQRFEIVLLVGLTEMRAYVAWDDNGSEKRGPAEIIYYG